MNNNKLIKKTFNNEFDQETYEEFLTELLNQPVYEENNISEQIDSGFKEYIESVSDYGTFEDSEQEEMKLYVVKLKRTSSLERARTMQRNFIAKLLSNDIINNALVAFYGDNTDWRFSFVKKTYKRENNKIEEELTLPTRHSYLVGPTQSNHTCQQQFSELLNENEISVNEIFKKFEVENVTDEFFKEYKELFHLLTESINQVKENDSCVKEEFENKKIETTDFAKKILGQIVFIYFIQKKGWLGVAKDQKWGTGPKDFLRKLYNKEFIDYTNFFNDVLEPLFYEGLSTNTVDNHYSKFNCKVPFINGGIFENINNYDWINTDVNIDNNIFEQILDTFDTFNFTVKEDEPLEKEVAIDPEMLGKVFEKLLEVNERKDKGAFYTPRHIVHEICQETLISYLNVNTEDIPKKDIEKFIKEGHMALDSIIRVQEQNLSEHEANKLIPIPNTIIGQMEIIEDLLNDVKVVDPAVGSGAFPVGMLTEIVQAKHIIQLLQGYNDVNMYDLKRETIENSLYAVDISYSATDITKLRFWLSLIVDEESIENIRPLPNLDNKIMCGNSLIDTFEGIKLFDEELLKSSKEKQTKLFDPTGLAFKKLLNYKSRYFNENIHEEKIKLKKQIQDTKWNFIEESLQENVKKGTKQHQIDKILEKLRKYKYAESKPFFIWELEFSEIFANENSGFDIIIGNPPYGGKLTKEEQKYLNDKYIKGASETAIAFIKLSYDNLIKNKGMFGFIIPKSFMYASNYRHIRSNILNDIYKIIDCGKVWKNVKLEQMILYYNKNVNTSSYESFIRIEEEFEFISHINKNTYEEFEILLNNVNNNEIQIAKKIRSNTFIKDISSNIRGVNGINSRIETKGKYPVIGGNEIQRNEIVGIKGYINDENIKSDNKAIIKPNSILVQNLVSHILNPIDHIQITANIPESKNYIIVDTINQLRFNSEEEMFYYWSYLNSKLINWYCYKFIYCRAIRTMHFDNPVTKKIPISNKLDTKIIDKSKKKYNLCLELTKIKRIFFKQLKNMNSDIEITNYMYSIHLKKYNDFEKYLKKQKITTIDFAQLKYIFNEYKKECTSLEEDIENLNNEINHLIYNTFNLTKKEIEVVETSF